jgi:glycosyltransferase involved in cell wall biosynthesis
VPTSAATGVTIPVLFAIPALDKAGPDRVFYELLRRLDRRRFAPALVTSSPDGFYLSRLPSDVRVNQLGRETSAWSRYPVAPLTRLVRQLRPAVVLATLRMAMTAGLARPAFPRGTRLIARPANYLTGNHGELVRGGPVRHRISFALYRFALGRADHLICQGDDLARDVAAVGLTVPSTTIGNPIDIEEIDRLAAAAAALPGRPSLLAVGRLTAQKGFDLLLPAFAQLIATAPEAREAHLTIVGNGPDDGALRRQCQDLGLAGRVTFRGFLENPYPLMRAADLYVLSSRYEGFPNVALEALACGTPVVAAACPGVSGLVLPGVNGWLAPPGDVAGLSAALQLAARTHAQLSPGAIRDSVRTRFAADQITERYERAILAVAAQRS